MSVLSIRLGSSLSMLRETKRSEIKSTFGSIKMQIIGSFMEPIISL